MILPTIQFEKNKLANAKDFVEKVSLLNGES